MNTRIVACVAAAFAVGQASAVVWTFNDTLSGLNEVPANASPGTGLIAGSYDDVSNVLSFNLTFSGLIGTTTAAHFHNAPVGVNGGVVIGSVGFPTGVTSGAYGNSYVLTAVQESQLMSGAWYYNVHSQVFPGGELRTQINLVPGPGALGLLGLGMLAAARRRR